LAQNRRIALDEQLNALGAVGDEAIAENETFAGFKLDLKSHSMPLPISVSGLPDQALF
jgi:hypothetical protein